MNRENLANMAEYIKTVPPGFVDMIRFRETNVRDILAKVEQTHKCNTIGCIIGHCTILDLEENLPRHWNGDIDFTVWSKQFTGLMPSSDEWKYLFGANWSTVDNTPEGAAKRIYYFLEHGLPATWKDEMNGKTKLSY